MGVWGTATTTTTTPSPPPVLSLLASFTCNAVCTGMACVGGLQEGGGGGEGVTEWWGGSGDSCMGPPATAGGVWVTSSMTGGDGSALLVGLSNGILQIRHCASLEVGGFFACHSSGQQDCDYGPGGRGSGAGGDAPPYKNTNNNNSGGGNFKGGGAAPSLKSLASSTFANFLGKVASLASQTPLADTALGSAAIKKSLVWQHKLGGLGAQEASPALLSAATSWRFLSHVVGGKDAGGGTGTGCRLPTALPPTAITSLLYANPTQSLLLVGCGDGRLVAVMDGGAEETANRLFEDALEGFL